MSKINAVRLINLNYNNQAIRISDETFRFNGESTLLSLRNGGGKSVLVQMMTAPFVHRRYQNTKDRPFSGYFTTPKPTFILVEWKLEQDAGYVLTGMMVRKNQEISEEREDELETVNFIAEYKEPCEQDIDHLPVVVRTKREVSLKSFHVCRQLFETYKRERKIPFFYYDMNLPAQARQYFDKLSEYQIYYKEWETIIKKINLKESGLSDLFADCRDEKGLVEKWFLEAVENKLNKEKNRMKEFQRIMEKYTGQYRDNRSKMERRDTIHAFEQEAERIMEAACRCREIGERLAGQEARIADFIRLLHLCEEQEQKAGEALREQKEELKQKLARLEYEKLSAEIHEITGQESKSRSNLEMLQMEDDSLERTMEEILHRLHLLACAKQQEEVFACGAEREREQQRLLLCLKKEKNLAPERERLGMQLRGYYLALGEKQDAGIAECLGRIGETERRKEREQEQLEELRRTERQLAGEAGALDARIKAYDDDEAGFNREYGENLCRNLDGEYEAGTFDILRAEYEKRLNQTAVAKTRAMKEAEQYKVRWKSLQRLLEDGTAERIRLEAGKDEAKRLLASYEEELSERRVILRYFGLKETELFETKKILSAAARRLTDTDLIRQGLEKERDVLKTEYRKLEQGQVLELPEAFEEMLREAGIHFVYGMEWLKKNRYTAEQNRRMAAEQPFLPYSLILSAQELKRLAALPDQVYTSFPVPILIREDLEQSGLSGDGAVRSFENVSFYVWFNDHLLDEETLARMLAEKEGRIQKLTAAIGQKKLEYAEYMERQEKIKSQKVSKQALEAAEEEMRRCKEALAASAQELLKKREELEHLEELQMKKERQIAELTQEISHQERRRADFGRLSARYEAYRENCRLMGKNRRETERSINLQKLKCEMIARADQELTTQKNGLALLERGREACAQKLAHYQQYEGEPQAEQLSEEEAKKAEIRYEAVTSGIGAEQKELEMRAEAAGRRYARASGELKSLQEKYRLAEAEWENVRYNKKEETHQEILLEGQERKRKRQKELIHEEEIRYALIRQEKGRRYEELKERCGKEEPVSRGEIRTIDFTEAIGGLSYRMEEAEKEEKRLEGKIQGYQNNLAALAEYEEFVCKEPVEWDCDFSAMTGPELTRQKGLLIRDYNSCIGERTEARTDLERVLNRMIRMEPFAEDFYRKPLEAMLELTEDAGRVIRQLETTAASYRSLMEKLLVDISLVEKEKKKIAELVGDYLKEVHENLGRIDRNSTITIRERPVKMLKIGLPDWAENESFYELRLADYLDDVTAKGVALLEENKNVQEYLGTKITTKSLYDAVVGIGNIQIRLYKVEAQREYPISWTDVARNSGGEGFLSAFVILSALLSYLRRDDTDLFAERNEGKVLLMDNPFAQTNASHLLTPLMDMAKKVNTQLICLSGLGGETIYNRFDNIYVLTLISANLRSDMQYLRAEHMKGSDEESVLTAQVAVTEQIL